MQKHGGASDPSVLAMVAHAAAGHVGATRLGRIAIKTPGATGFGIRKRLLWSLTLHLGKGCHDIECMVGPLILLCWRWSRMPQLAMWEPHGWDALLMSWSEHDMSAD
jgi:hypothetical protein